MPVSTRRRWQRAVLSTYSAIWLVLLLFVNVMFCPEISRSYHAAVRDILGGHPLPKPIQIIGVSIIGIDPHLAGGQNGLVHYLYWTAIYASALIPLLLLYTTKDKEEAFYHWTIASIGSALLVLVILVIAIFTLSAPLYFLI